MVSEAALNPICPAQLPGRALPTLPGVITDDTRASWKPGIDSGFLLHPVGGHFLEPILPQQSLSDVSNIEKFVNRRPVSCVLTDGRIQLPFWVP